jgi:nitroreductase
MQELNTPDYTAQTLERLLSERHSCRAYLPEAVPQAAIAKVFSTAQRAASWSNSQAWQVTVVSGSARDRLSAALMAAGPNDRLSDFALPHAYTGPYQDRRRECGFQLYDALGISKGDKEGAARQMKENFRFFGAPHAAIFTSDPGLGAYGAVDVGGYVQLVLLAMQAHGLAAIAQGAIAVYSPLVKRQLGISEERLVVCGMSFGYEDTAHPANSFRTTRAPVQQVVDWLA